MRVRLSHLTTTRNVICADTRCDARSRFQRSCWCCCGFYIYRSHARSCARSFVLSFIRSLVGIRYIPSHTPVEIGMRACTLRCAPSCGTQTSERIYHVFFLVSAFLLWLLCFRQSINARARISSAKTQTRGRCRVHASRFRISSRRETRRDATTLDGFSMQVRFFQKGDDEACHHSTDQRAGNVWRFHTHLMAHCFHTHKPTQFLNA